MFSSGLVSTITSSLGWDCGSIGSGMTVGITSSPLSSSSVSSIGVSSKTVFSFKTTVSKCAKGLFIVSLKFASGENETLVWPFI